MNLRLLDFLIDPNDGGALRAHTFEGDEHSIREGVLLNPETGRWFPIRDGIASVFHDGLRAGMMREEDEIFVARHDKELHAIEGITHLEEFEHDHRAHDFKRMESERRARDEQAEEYDRMISMKMLERFEVPAYKRVFDEYSIAPLDTPLLEAGCGTGRFTALFARYASEVVAVDLSRDSILRNRVRHAGKTDAPVHYLHADLTHLPLRDDLFARIAHIGVYEHIPSRQMRTQFIAHAARVLDRNGTLMLSAYRYNGITKMFGKEGEHDGGIPFFRFTEEELRGEVEPCFEINYWQENLGIYMSLLGGTPKK
jgi:SAM-dependent methyltransferase/uncharacterized protein YbaR (Trm112 family)